MSGLTVPGGTFAVFTHRGTMPSFGKTIAAIWREWIPASGLKPTHAPDFERYDGRFQHDSPASEMDVYVPVVAP
jgi:AraC family transcriptional regulator